MNPFSAFSTFVLRTPLLPISFYTALLKEYDREKLFTTLEDPIIKSALALASPELFRELEKYKDQPTIYNQEKAKNLEQSLFKYIALQKPQYNWLPKKRLQRIHNSTCSFGRIGYSN